MIFTILLSISVTLWCLFSFALYGYHYILEVILDLPIVGESPCSAHSALKLIIQKIIREANDLPKLRGEGTTNALDQENRTYEDLLSTAILNKIINTSQNNQSLGTACSSRANSVCSHRSSSSRRKEKEYFFGEETLYNKWKNVDTDTASVSSLEEWVHSDSSLGSTKYVDRLSLTIKQRIEEVSSSDTDEDVEPEDEHDDAEYFRSNSSFESNHPNWLLQKRTFRGSPIPVPMLVPDPTSEVKVLIGDKEIDDTSDLSDVPSDFEEEQGDRGSSLDVKNHLIESKTLIGGKNPLADLNMSHMSDDEISADSGVKECKDLDEVDSEAFSTSKHENEFPVDGSICSDGSNTERDTEYTERYATLPRTILISPKTNRSQENRNSGNNKENDNDKLKTNDLKETSDEENDIGFTGVYSQREKEKWKHAVELKNNPYSKENIEKRIKSRNSINSLFGSDYYIRQACLPSGAKRTEDDHFKSSEENESPIIEEENLINEEQLKEVEEKFEIEIENSEIVLATAVYIDETAKDSEKFQNLNSLENSLEIFDPETQFSSEITSDSDVSLVNCYDVTESVVYKKITGENDEEIQTAQKFFDFESLESSIEIPEETKKEELAKPVAKPRKRVNSEQTGVAKRENVETELNSVKLVKYKDTTEDSFDTIPYIINKRSDNTLIKKIYSNPSVRSFALNKRNKLPILIDDAAVLKPEQNKKSPDATKLENVKSLSKNIKETEKFEIIPKSTETKLFSSTPAKESIAKISGEIEKETKQNGENEIEFSHSQSQTQRNKIINSDYEALEEINELKEKKLVANRLKEFSKSSINLSQISDDHLDKSFSSGIGTYREYSKEDEDNVGRKLSGMQNGERSTSVRDLRKKFELFDSNAKGEKPILYSLTGRSISKQFKEKLRDLNVDHPPLSQIHSLSLTNLEVEENTR